MTKRTTVSLDARVYQRLKSRGEFGETFSEVVRRILDQLDAINGSSEK
jgi:predicted CopG family antitoxin